MFAKHQGIYGGRSNAEVTGEMRPEAQAVKERPGAKHALMPGSSAGDIGERVRWIGHDDDHRVLHSSDDGGNEFPVNLGVGGEELQPAFLVAPIGCASGLFVDAGSEENDRATGQIRDVAA